MQHVSMPLSKVFRSPSPLKLSSSTLTHRRLYIKSLTQQQIHIWEHAALLYHWYEWHSAANAFDSLSRNIEPIEERSLCFINVGLIETRLGNLEKAANAFDKAITVNPGLHIAYWLSARIHCANAEYDKAEAYVEICLEGFSEDDISYHSRGLDFVLHRSSLMGGLRTIRSAQLDAASGVVAYRSVNLDGLPAELIFEAPSRSISQPNSLKRSFSRGRGSAHTSQTSIVSNRDEGLKPGEEPDMETQRPASPYCRHSMRSSSSPLHVYQQGLRNNKADSAGELISLGSPPSRTTSKTESFLAIPKRLNGWTRRPSTPFIPRNARVDSGSTRELARFIRNGGQVRPAQILSPKNARGEHESLEELAQFFRHYDPNTASLMLRERLKSDPQRPLISRTGKLDQAVAESTTTSQAANSVLSQSAVYHTQPHGTARLQSLPELSDYARLWTAANNEILGNEESDAHSTLGVLPSASSVYTSVTKPDSSESGLVFLQPTVYKPPSPKLKHLTPPARRVPSPSPSAFSEGPATTTASTSDGFYQDFASPERRMMARGDALQALEGNIAARNSDKPRLARVLPSLPVGNSGGSLSPPDASDTISTLDFFDKVLGSSRKP